MRTCTTMQRFFVVSLFVGYSISSGQPGFRFPVGESVFVDAVARALRCEDRQAIERPITSETVCGATAAANCVDQDSWEERPPTLGGGWGWSHVEATSGAISVAKGNKAWIHVYAYGATGAIAVAAVNNDDECGFALQHTDSDGDHGAGGRLPFIMPETGPVVVRLSWFHTVSSGGGASGECGGPFCEPYYSFYVSGAGYWVFITDSAGNIIFAESLSTTEPGRRDTMRELYLPAGRYLLEWRDFSDANSSAVAVVCPLEPRCIMACTVTAGGGSGTSLGVGLIAYRHTIPIPLEAVRADIDGSYSVDDGDLLSVFAEWGNDGRESLADVNDDGIVDDADLLMVLQWFGTEY